MALLRTNKLLMTGTFLLQSDVDKGKQTDNNKYGWIKMVAAC